LSDKFSTLAEIVKAKIKEEGGKIAFRNLAKWAENTEIGSLFVLYAIVKDLIDRGELVVSEGYEEDPELMSWRVPKVVTLPEVVREEETIEEGEERPRLDIDVEKLDEDLKRTLSYLSEYWSVGEIRFRLDLKKLGLQDPDKVLLRLLDLGIVELTPTGVVNLKFELPKVKKKTSLAGLI